MGSKTSEKSYFFENIIPPLSAGDQVSDWTAWELASGPGWYIQSGKIEVVERLDVQTVSIEEKSSLWRCSDHFDCSNEEPLSAN